MDEFVQQVKMAIESQTSAVVDVMDDGSLEVEYTDQESGQTTNYTFAKAGS